MPLETLYYLSQIIAVLAVLASLIFVGVQIRQNTKQAQQANELARAELTQDGWQNIGTRQFEMVDTPEKAAFLTKTLYGNEPLDLDEHFRFSIILHTLIGHYEIAYRQVREGLLYEDILKRYQKSMTNYFMSKRFRSVWKETREIIYTDPFRSHVDELCEAGESLARQLIAKEKQTEGEL